MSDQDNNYDDGHDIDPAFSSEDVAEMNEEARGQTPRGPQETQDLHVSKPHGPDKNWPAGDASRMMPAAITPTAERLARSSQFVSIRNSSDRIPGVHGRITPQTHIVLDRHQRGIQLQPGETRHNVEMLVSDIDYFLRAGVPNRTNDFGARLPRHPLEILDVDRREIAQKAKEDEQRKQEARKRKAAHEAEEANKQFRHSAIEDDGEHGEPNEAHEHKGRRPLRSKKK